MLPCTYNIQQKLGAFFFFACFVFLSASNSTRSSGSSIGGFVCLFGFFFQEASTVAK